MRERTKKQERGSYPGIKKIYWVRADQLQPGILYLTLSGMPVAVLADKNEISFSGEPDLSIERGKVNNNDIEKVKLSFHSSDELPTDIKICFLIETVSAERYIIGAKESRWPVISAVQSVGSTKNKATSEYTVTHIAQKSLIKCYF